MRPTKAMRERRALLEQWATLRHHGVRGFRGFDPVTDPRRATSLSIYEYQAQDPSPDDGLTDGLRLREQPPGADVAPQPDPTDALGGRPVRRDVVGLAVRSRDTLRPGLAARGEPEEGPRPHRQEAPPETPPLTAMDEPVYISVAEALRSPEGVLLVFHRKCSGEKPVAYSPMGEGFPPWDFACPVCGERPRRKNPDDDELTYSFALAETCRGLPIVPLEAIFPMNKPLSYEATMEPQTGSDATTPLDEWIAGYCGALNNARRQPGATLLDLLELAGIDPHDIPEGIDDDQDEIRRAALADLNEEP